MNPDMASGNPGIGEPASWFWISSFTPWTRSNVEMMSCQDSA